LSVYPTWRAGATGAYTARIRVEDVDNPAAFTGAPNNIRGRTYWTTTVDWAIPAGGLPTDQWSDSPSIKDLVQYAVNSPGWSEGNYIGIAIWGQTGNGGCGEGVNDFSSNPSYTAKLHIEYRTVDTSSTPDDVKLATTSNWYDTNWSYRKQISIDYTKVDADLTDFPVLISLASDSGLVAHAQSDGDDILFTSSDGTKLSHEIEEFDDSIGKLVAWVKVPTLSSSTDTDIYMYYGNSSASNQQNVTGTTKGSASSLASPLVWK
ncbi:unnamed protein product, partial [marine sediment metagenome]